MVKAITWPFNEVLAPFSTRIPPHPKKQNKLDFPNLEFNLNPILLPLAVQKINHSLAGGKKHAKLSLTWKLPIKHNFDKIKKQMKSGKR